MKKFLLTLATVALCGSMASADEVTLDLKDATNFVGTHVEETLNDDQSVKKAEHYEPIEAFEIAGYKFTAAKGEGSSAPTYYCPPSTKPDGDYTLRIYKANSFTITAPEGTEMTQIVFNLAANKNKDNFNVNSGACAHDEADNFVITWTGNASTLEFTPADKGNIQIKSLIVTTGTSTMETVEMPTFTPASGTTFTDQLSVTIEAAEGATVYYTLDGTNPTAESNKYEAPIAITETTTVKAIAVKEGMNDSPVATATYNKEVVMMTFEELITAGLEDEETVFTYGGEAVVTYVNGSNLYVRDDSFALLIYGKLDKTYQPGDVITGFKGTFKNYFSTWELMAVADSFGDPVKTVDAEPEEFTIGTITEMDQNKYIVLRDVTVNPDALTLTKGTDEIALYNKFKIELPTASVNKDVIGLVSYYQAKGADAPALQIYPVALNEPTALESIEAENEVYAIGGSIVAPAGAEIYSVSGARVNGSNLNSGIYLVRTQNDVVKVLVK